MKEQPARMRSRTMMPMTMPAMLALARVPEEEEDEEVGLEGWMGAVVKMVSLRLTGVPGEGCCWQPASRATRTMRWVC
jgi:hypothetical protein